MKRAKQIAQAVLETAASELDRVPGDGEEVTLQWKHNLGLGAQADFVVPEQLQQRLEPLALRAMDAVGLVFGSVDVISVRGELRILEINSGVMMDHLLTQGAESSAAQAPRSELRLLACGEAGVWSAARPESRPRPSGRPAVLAWAGLRGRAGALLGLKGCTSPNKHLRA